MEKALEVMSFRPEFREAMAAAHAAEAERARSDAEALNAKGEAERCRDAEVAEASALQSLRQEMRQECRNVALAMKSIKESFAEVHLAPQVAGFRFTELWK